MTTNPQTQVQKVNGQVVASNLPQQERKKLLLGMYQENCSHARHYESLRLSVTSMTLAANDDGSNARDGNDDASLARVAVIKG